MYGSLWCKLPLCKWCLLHPAWTRPKEILYRGRGIYANTGIAADASKKSCGSSCPYWSNHYIWPGAGRQGSRKTHKGSRPSSQVRHHNPELPESIHGSEHPNCESARSCNIHACVQTILISTCFFPRPISPHRCEYVHIIDAFTTVERFNRRNVSPKTIVKTNCIHKQIRRVSTWVGRRPV